MPTLKQERIILTGALLTAVAIIVTISLKAEGIVNKETVVNEEIKTKVSILTTDVVEDQS